MSNPLVHDASVIADGVQVIFIGPRPKIGKPSDPFATVVGTSLKVKTGSATYVGLHVFRDEDAEFSFADGILALDNNAVFIGKAVKWPELNTALSLPVKGYEGVTNVRPNEPSHVRVKILEEDGYAASPPDPNAGHGVMALNLLRNWNRWLEENATFNARALELDPTLKVAAAKLVISAADNLRKFCGKIGLNKKRRVNFDSPWRELCGVLRLAEKVDSRLRDAQ